MRKTFKALQMIVLSAVVAMVFCVMPVMASDLQPRTEDYTYTIRIYAGNQGTFGGASYLEYTGQKAGDIVPFDFGSVSLKNGDKYYVSGIRESGKDNYDPEHPQVSAVTVTGDADYVVAYGILGSSVAYTVNYVDAAGNTLLPSDTLYGNVGDRPVIAFKYIEDYFPNAYNLTRTLTENAADNVFTFVYQSTIVTVPATEEEGGGAAAPAAPAAPVAPAAPEGGAVAPEGGEAAPEGGEVINPGETPGTAPGELPSSPDEVPDIVDIDNPEVPLAPGNSNSQANAEQNITTNNKANQGLSGLGIAGIAAGGVVVVGGIAALGVALAKRKKSDN